MRKVLLVGVSLVMLCGCGPVRPDQRPLITDALVVCADQGELHGKAGLHFSVSNPASLGILELAVRFSLWDTGGDPFPNALRNEFQVSLPVSIAAGGNARVVASLDDWVSSDHDSLVVSRIRPVLARYTGGNTWRSFENRWSR